MRIFNKFFITYIISIINIFLITAYAAASNPVTSGGDIPVTINSGNLVESSHVAPSGSWHFKAGGEYVFPVTGSKRLSCIRMDTLFGLGLPLNFELNFNLPYLVNAGSDNSEIQKGTGPGDFKTSLLFSPKSEINGGLSLLLGTSLYFPVGNNSRGFGEGQFSLKSFMVMEWNILGAVLTFNTGYLVRPEHKWVPSYKFEEAEDVREFTQDDEFFIKGRIRIIRNDDIAWSIEASWSTGLGVFMGDKRDFINSPLYLGGGIDFSLKNGGRIQLSMLFPLNYSQSGIIAGIIFSGSGEGSDSDYDGVINKSDKCPLLPEDIDGFEDGDGCPDIDNDMDGVPDIEDKCPDIKGDEFSDNGC